MAVTLEYIGKGVAKRHTMAFLDGLRRKFPLISEAGLHEIAKSELVKTPPRDKHTVQQLIGADVLAEDVTMIDAWPLLTKTVQSLILRTPAAHRHQLIDPEGLSRTYVWRASTDWLAQVEDADAEIIFRSAARHWFQNIERHGRFTPVRAWDLPVVEREGFVDLHEAKRYEKDLQRKPLWNGM